MKTYNDVCICVRKALKQAGIEAFQLESRLLVASAAGKTMEELLRDYSLYVNEDFENKVMEMTRRRILGEPIAYITGEWEFYGMVFHVDENVLIPRSDTEILTEVAVRFLKKRESKRALDLCTGSGCIGLAIANFVPSSRVVAVDKSLKALSVCRMNVARHKLVRSVTCVDCDVMEKPPILLGRFDLIVSNPPYIPRADIEALDASVRDHEPRMALDGGEDGLDFYRSIIGKWSCLLKDGGKLMLECGIGQAAEVVRMLSTAGYEDITVLKDTLDIDRVVTGTYREGEEDHG